MSAVRRAALAGLALGCLVFGGPSPVAAQRAAGAPKAAYFPEPGNAWERRAPRQVGMDSVRLAEAIAFAIAE
ncbi:MAG: hypothetical protein U5K74_06820 [Gemmatimonadaceae bacterium]|nr:hypothetical protein [Gemmatimonadaceae bacterium]